MNADTRVLLAEFVEAATDALYQVFELQAQHGDAGGWQWARLAEGLAVLLGAARAMAERASREAARMTPGVEVSNAVRP